MIHKNKRTHHSAKPERKNAFHFHCSTNGGAAGFNYKFKHNCILLFIVVINNLLLGGFYALIVSLVPMNADIGKESFRSCIYPKTNSTLHICTMFQIIYN